jgi:multiple sugar transport system permease protein
MGILSQVGRKKSSVRALIGGLYTLLVFGSVSIFIPLMVMLTLSVSSVTDVKQIALFPRYFFSDAELLKKQLAEKYSEKLESVRQNYPVEGQNWLNWNQVDAKIEDLAEGIQAGHRTLAGDWDAWLLTLPSDYYAPGYANEQGQGPSQVAFQKFLMKRYGTVANFNTRTKSNLKYISTANFPVDTPASTTWFYDETPFSRDYFEFKAGLDAETRLPQGVNRLWDAWLKFRYHESINELNKAWGSSYADAFFNDVAFPLQRPAQAVQSKDWADFVKERYPRSWITLGKDHSPAYKALLKQRFKTVGDLNVAAGTALHSWDELKCPLKAPQRAEVKFWSEFVASLPLEDLQLDSAELQFRAMALKKYGSVEAAATAYGVKLTDAHGVGIMLPARVPDEVKFEKSTFALRCHFIGHNYFAVGRFLLQQGSSALNTGILVVLSIFTALLVNPLAAYALSRFRLSYMPKVLLFLLATAAFPAEVTAIPQFLMIKNLGMLNTFWALVLPGLVNGFWIFMLKGFFDSLPKELYEAAIMEGAGEYDLFFKITVPMAAPILALTAFGAFGAAYGGYLWNIIVANDAKMWTLMVALQQYMAPPTPQQLVMAAVVLISIPTLIAFLLVQRVILRGIVIPTMH